MLYWCRLTHGFLEYFAIVVLVTLIIAFQIQKTKTVNIHMRNNVIVPDLNSKRASKGNPDRTTIHQMGTCPKYLKEVFPLLEGAAAQDKDRLKDVLVPLIEKNRLDCWWNKEGIRIGQAWFVRRDKSTETERFFLDICKTLKIKPIQEAGGWNSLKWETTQK